MATSLDVAAYILRANGGPDECQMRAKSLQKLVYYAQVWSMVWDGRPLFTEPVEAWRDGPVVGGSTLPIGASTRSPRYRAAMLRRLRMTRRRYSIACSHSTGT